MRIFELTQICLNLFDGGAATGGAAAGDGGAASAAGDTQAVSGSTRRGKKSGEYSNVVFGKQSAQSEAEPAGAPAAEEKKAEVKTTSNTLDERRKAYHDLINGEYKDLYTADTQRIINQRFKDAKQTESALQAQQPVIDLLMERYKITDGDITKLKTAVEGDKAYWAEAAEENGMTPDAYMEFAKMRRENEAFKQAEAQARQKQNAENQLRQWFESGEELKAIYPDFDLNTECANPRFLALLKAGIPVKDAYEVIHMDVIMGAMQQQTMQRTEERVVQNIRARGARPSENGASSQSAFTVKDDVSKLSRKDRAEIARRAARGETIRF